MADRIPLYLDFEAGVLRELVSPDVITPGGVKILTYTSDGTEGDSFTITGLVDKNIIGAFRATGYKRVINTVPVSTDYIGIEGTDNTENGVLATGGVNLVSGDALVDGEVLDFIYT